MDIYYIGMYVRDCVCEIFRINVSSRVNTKKQMAKGLFLNAVVVRGHDWMWSDQDGR